MSQPGLSKVESKEQNKKVDETVKEIYLSHNIKESTYIERDKHRMLIRVIGITIEAKHLEFKKEEECIEQFDKILEIAKKQDKEMIISEDKKIATIDDFNYINILLKRRKRKKNKI